MVQRTARGRLGWHRPGSDSLFLFHPITNGLELKQPVWGSLIILFQQSRVLKDRVCSARLIGALAGLNPTQQIKHATPTWSGGSIASMLFFTPDYGFIGTADGGLWR